MNLEDILLKKADYINFNNHFSQGKLSHAFLVISSDSEVIKTQLNLFAKLILKNEIKITSKTHPDLFIFENPEKSFLVADCQNMLNFLTYRPVESDYKVIIINPKDISNIVQNKMLKTLEEPTKNTIIFLCGKSLDNFLPTVISRCQVINLPTLSKEDFETLGLSDQYKFSFGNVSNALKFKNAYTLNKFNSVLECFKSLEKSADVILYTRTLAKDKEDFESTLQLIELAFILNMHDLKNGKNDLGLVDYYDLKTSAHVIDLIKEYRLKLKYNVSYNAVFDNLLLNILEVRYKCKQNLL